MLKVLLRIITGGGMSIRNGVTLQLRYTFCKLIYANIQTLFYFLCKNFLLINYEMK